MKRIVLIATVLAFSSPVIAQDHNPGRSDGRAPAADAAPAEQKAPRPNLRQQAQEKFAAWKDQTRSCLEKAGLVFGKHFRVKPGYDRTYQIHDNVWIDPSFNHDEIEKCG